MIEMRWLDREIKNLHPMTNVVNGRPREKVLQYRYQWVTAEYTRMDGSHVKEHGWSPWTDVPDVRDGDKRE